MPVELCVAHAANIPAMTALDAEQIAGCNTRASRRLRERFGFRMVAVFSGVGCTQGRWLDSVQMQRALGSGAPSSF